MLFLHEQLVAIINQMTIPLIEVSLVLGKYTKMLSTKLQESGHFHDEEIYASLSSPLPLDVELVPAGDDVSSDNEGRVNAELLDPSLLVSRTDVDRMDILDTVIRTAINSRELPQINALQVLRDWEKLSRTQLARAKSPGQLFSPLVIPEGY